MSANEGQTVRIAERIHITNIVYPKEKINVLLAIHEMDGTNQAIK